MGIITLLLLSLSRRNPTFVGCKLDIMRYGSIVTVLELLLDFIFLYTDLTIIWFLFGHFNRRK